MANLKYYNTTTGLWEEIKVSTKFKDLYHTTKLTQDQNYAPIGITNYNPNEDVIFSIVNSTWLQKDEDFIVNGGLLRIESKDGSNWKNGDTFNFVVLKNVDKDAVPTADGSLIQDGSITIAKLATSIQTYITKIGVAELTTIADDLSGAVNELNAELSKKANQSSLNTTNTNVTANTASITNHLADLITDNDGVHGLKVETGTWTPKLCDVNGVQLSNIVKMGTYERINKKVQLNFKVKINGVGSASGIIILAGLPFTENTTDYYKLNCVIETSNTNIEFISGGISNSYITLKIKKEATAIADLTTTNIPTDLILNGNLIYYTA